MTKRGNLLNNFLSIFIAALLIGLLGFAVAKLLGVFRNPEDKNAQELLNSLVGKIELLKDGEKNSFLMKGAEGWYLLAYDSRNDADDRPQKCYLDNCICIAPEPTKDSCQNEGFHRIVNKDFIFIDGGDYYTRLTLIPGSEVVDLTPTCLKFGKNLDEISISKSKNLLQISKESDERVFINVENRESLVVDSDPILEYCIDEEIKKALGLL